MGVLGPAVARVAGRLVERDGELEEIDRALAGASGGGGWLLVVEGPAGIGKSALLREAGERAGSAGLVVLSARGGELEGGFPYGVVRQLLEATVRSADPAGRERLLGGAAGLATPAVLGTDVGRVDPAARVFAVLHGLYWLVANLAAEAPLVLLVDDAHWADAPSLRFLAYLARRLDGVAATVIASVRTGEGGSDQDLLGELEGAPRAAVAVPAALSDAGVASVLDTVFGLAPDPGFVRCCVEATGGNPFFVRELAGALIADGIGPTAQAAERVYAVAPRTIARITLARLARLSADAAELARAIAVLGADATLPRAAWLAGLDEIRALGALDALVTCDVLAREGGLVFRHPIVRAAIYDELAPGARSALHHRAARMLEAEGVELDVVAGQLVRSESAGATDTIATLRSAAEHALALGTPDSAIAYLARALEEGPERTLRTEILLELGLAEKLARQPSAIECLEESRQLADDPHTRAVAAIEEAEILMYLGQWQLAVSLFDGALEEIAGLDQALTLRAEAMRATLAIYDARLVPEVMERLPRLRRLAASGSAGARPLAMLLACWSAQRDEPSERIRALLERGWDDGRYLAEGDSIEALPQGIGALVLCDELARAAEMVAAVRAAARTNGSVIHSLLASAHAALIETQRGNLAAAAAEMHETLERALELGLPVWVAVTLGYCTDVLFERPDVADLAALPETLELGPMAEGATGAMVIAVRGRLRFADGRRAAAIADLRHAGAICQALGLTNLYAVASWRSTLALMLDADHREEALALCHAELADAEASGQARRIGISLRALGVLEQDQLQLEHAVAVLADSPAGLEHARALVELGAAHRRHGNRAAARAPLRQGLDHATRCGATRLAQRARTELEATGARPRRQYTTGRDALTPSELRVAQLAADGATSQQIAEALFVTTKTIDAHLNHAYTKLGIHSRKQLAAALRNQVDPEPQPTPRPGQERVPITMNRGSAGLDTWRRGRGPSADL